MNSLMGLTGNRLMQKREAERYMKMHFATVREAKSAQSCLEPPQTFLGKNQVKKRIQELHVEEGNAQIMRRLYLIMKENRNSHTVPYTPGVRLSPGMSPVTDCYHNDKHTLARAKKLRIRTKLLMKEREARRVLEMNLKIHKSIAAVKSVYNFDDFEKGYDRNKNLLATLRTRTPNTALHLFNISKDNQNSEIKKKRSTSPSQAEIVTTPIKPNPKQGIRRPMSAFASRRTHPLPPENNEHQAISNTQLNGSYDNQQPLDDARDDDELLGNDDTQGIYDDRVKYSHHHHPTRPRPQSAINPRGASSRSHSPLKHPSSQSQSDKGLRDRDRDRDRAQGRPLMSQQLSDEIFYNEDDQYYSYESYSKDRTDSDGRDPPFSPLDHTQHKPGGGRNQPRSAGVVSNSKTTDPGNRKSPKNKERIVASGKVSPYSHSSPVPTSPGNDSYEDPPTRSSTGLVYPHRRSLILQSQLYSIPNVSYGQDNDNSLAKTEKEIEDRSLFVIRVVDVGLICPRKILRRVPNEDTGEDDEDDEDMPVATSTGVHVEASLLGDPAVSCKIFLSMKKLRLLAQAAEDTLMTMVLGRIPTREKQSGLYDCIADHLDRLTAESFGHLILDTMDVIYDVKNKPNKVCIAILRRPEPSIKNSDSPQNTKSSKFIL